MSGSIVLHEVLKLPLVGATKVLVFGGGWDPWEDTLSPTLDCDGLAEGGKKDPVTLLELSELAGLGGKGDEGEDEITCCELIP